MALLLMQFHLLLPYFSHSCNTQDAQLSISDDLKEQEESCLLKHESLMCSIKGTHYAYIHAPITAKSGEYILRFSFIKQS